MESSNLHHYKLKFNLTFLSSLHLLHLPSLNSEENDSQISGQNQRATSILKSSEQKKLRFFNSNHVERLFEIQYCLSRTRNLPQFVCSLPLRIDIPPSFWLKICQSFPSQKYFHPFIFFIFPHSTVKKMIVKFLAKIRGLHLFSKVVSR